MDYPNPCTTCETKTADNYCNKFRYCAKYHKWINWNWATFRRYARRAKEKKAICKTWVYQHPDRAREYLKNGPCKGCKLNDTCDDPCRAYLEWWDARMDYFRSVMGQ